MIPNKTKRESQGRTSEPAMLENLLVVEQTRCTPADESRGDDRGEGLPRSHQAEDKRAERENGEATVQLLFVSELSEPDLVAHPGQRAGSHTFELIALLLEAVVAGHVGRSLHCNG